MKAKFYVMTVEEAWMMSETGSNLSLEPWGGDTREYKGRDDGGIYYDLPPGVHLAHSNVRSLELYDEHDRHLEYISDRGCPTVIMADGSEVKLEPSVDNAIGHKDGKDRADFIEGLEGEGRLYIP